MVTVGNRPGAGQVSTTLDGAAKVVEILERIQTEVGKANIKSIGLINRNREPEKIGITRGHANYQSEKNSEDNQTNADLLGAHRLSGRDIITPSQETADKCAQAFVDLLELEIQRALDHSDGRPAGKNPDSTANSLMAMGLKEAMRAYMTACSACITEQKDYQGSPLRALSREYAREKIGAVGFEIPILVRTGQIRDNLNPSEAAKNLKYSRS